MRNFLLYVIFLFFSGHSIVAQKKCDDKILLSVSEKIGRLTQPEITSFLMTLGAECRNNIEFSEWSNELLFAVLDRQTELTLRTMGEEKRNIDLRAILNDLEEPIYDHVKLDELIAKVKKIRINRRLKNRIVARLRGALSSSN